MAEINLKITTNIKEEIHVMEISYDVNNTLSDLLNDIAGEYNIENVEGLMVKVALQGEPGM